MIGDKTKPKKASPKPSQDHPMAVKSWPTERRPEGIGLSAKDGFNFFIGGLVAWVIFLVLISCFIFFGIAAFGASIGSLF